MKKYIFQIIIILSATIIGISLFINSSAVIALMIGISIAAITYNFFVIPLAEALDYLFNDEIKPYLICFKHADGTISGSVWRLNKREYNKWSSRTIFEDENDNKLTICAIKRLTEKESEVLK